MAVPEVLQPGIWAKLSIAHSAAALTTKVIILVVLPAIQLVKSSTAGQMLKYMHNRMTMEAFAVTVKAVLVIAFLG